MLSLLESFTFVRNRGRAMRIAIIDDNAAIREGLKYYLSKREGYDVIIDVSDGSDAIKHKDIASADVIICDIMMSHLNGIETVKQLQWLYPGIKVLALTMYHDKVYLQELIEAGFKGCVFKSKIFSELNKAIETVYSGRYYFPDDMDLAS